MDDQAKSKSTPTQPPPLPIAAAPGRLPFGLSESQMAEVVAGSDRPLDVKDALGYLDAVKNQFKDHPDVYNLFLDIMKDFKSQAIDTPGVINRVSRLFKGHPVLIQGFNTFLPVGYRIDVSTDPLDPTSITVTTPTGTHQHHTTSPTLPGLRTSRDIPGFGPNIAQPFVGLPPVQVAPLVPVAPISRAITPHNVAPTKSTPSEIHLSGSKSKPQTHQDASLLMNNEDRQSEFTDAIQYLNLIKARYNNDDNATYKQFLDILQAYQKEQRSTSDTHVYSQVQKLFKDAPDLLADFRNFLPEAMNVRPPTETAWNTFPDSPPPVPAPKKATTAVTAKRKRKPIEKDSTPAPPPKATTGRATKKPKQTHIPESPPPRYREPTPPPPPEFIPGSGYAPQAVPSRLSPSSDKLLFFDRAKKILETRDTYEEFLKLLNLYSKEIIDLPSLVESSQVFLGDNRELMEDFKSLVGWDRRRDNVEDGPPGSIRTGPPEALAALYVDDGQGPSYRRLPASEVRLACSGRDELCRSVLNDEWVSHPTWASEDAGFVTHKKNTFEDALHRSEEERHEYQVQLEALSRTISVFDPLLLRIEEMSNDERVLFRLDADFGGPSRCIYHRVIRKIYGKDAGAEVIAALQDSPSVVVPVVLARLKQKDDEWRRLQREWAKTWKEVDAKNFYKALDHQGINFKATDKKQVTAKHFVADIQAIKAAQEEVAAHEGKGKGRAPDVQLEFKLDDTAVLHDCLKLIFVFLDRSPGGQYTSQERRAVEKYLRKFVPTLCMYPASELDAAFEHDRDDEAAQRATRSPLSAHSTGVSAVDLRYRLVKAAQDRAAGISDARESASVPNSRAGSKSPPIQLHGDLNDSWIACTVDSPADFQGERPFFTNTTFYTLLRLLQVLYSRLVLCKDIGQGLADDNHNALRANPVAIELGLEDPSGPSTVLASAIKAFGKSDEKTNVIYMYFLDACERMFGGELDFATFEEHMRWFFGQKSYHLSTIDKLIAALVKQVQTIVADNKCQELWSLQESAQRSEVVLNEDIIRYRREAERHVGQDDQLYRLQWSRQTRTMSASLVSSADPSVNVIKEPRDRWREYVATYSMVYPTEWLPPYDRMTSGSLVLQKRNSRPVAEGNNGVTTEGQLRARVGFPTYRLAFEAGSEQSMYRFEKDPVILDRATRRAEERKRCRLLL